MRFFKGFITEHVNDEQGLDAFVLAIYSMVIFPGVMGYVEMAMMDFFKQI